MCVQIGNTRRTRCKRVPCIQFADIALLLDCSGSITRNQFRRMLLTIADFLKNFDIGPNTVQVAIVPFNDFIQKPTKLNSYSNRRDLIKRLMRYADSHTKGGTRTDKALRFMRKRIFKKSNGDRVTAPNIGIVFTDGRSNRPNRTAKEAEKLKSTNIFMVSVGIGNKINKTELELISTNGTVLQTNFKNIGDIITPLLNATCDYTIVPCYFNPCKNGGSCHPYKTTYICNCKSGYAGKNCELKCDITGDMVLALDESGSINRQKFDKIVDAAICLVKAADIANGKMRIGVITWAKKVFVHYDLDAFHNKIDLLFVLDLLRYMYKGGPTNTHLALKYLKDEAFTPARGDRMGFANFAVIFTDGKSTRTGATKFYADKLHESGVSIYAIGIGPRVNKREIFYIASKPKRHHFFLTTFKKLDTVMHDLEKRICHDLKPWGRCWKCKHNCDCDPGMICCNNCCVNQVTVLTCPKGPRKFQCATAKNCFYPFNVCWRGHCRTLRYVKREKCRPCGDNHHCSPGWKCCRGCCVIPKVNKVGCVGSHICTMYLKYRSCGDGMKCCSRCKDYTPWRTMN